VDIMDALSLIAPSWRDMYIAISPCRTQSL
jgi:hypothetical protein